MANLFRQAAVDKLRSPEQLDKMITVTRPSTWISIAGIAVIIIAAIIWSVFGTISTKISGDGIFLTSNGVSSVYGITETDNENVIILYLPLSEGKKAEVGMEVKIHPSTAGEEEYGHMEGTVIYVDEYVADRDSMEIVLGEESLVDTFLQDGPVVTVICSLKTDPETKSGYYWSTDKGGEVELKQATLVSADIVLDEQSPISLIIPIFREELQAEGAAQ